MRELDVRLTIDADDDVDDNAIEAAIQAELPGTTLIRGPEGSAVLDGVTVVGF